MSNDYIEYEVWAVYGVMFLPVFLFIRKAFKKKLGHLSWLLALTGFIPGINIIPLWIARDISGYNNSNFAFFTFFPFLNFVNFWVMVLSDLPIDRERIKKKKDLKKIYSVELDWNSQRSDILAALESGNYLDKEWAIDLLRRHERAGVNECTQLLAKYE